MKKIAVVIMICAALFLCNSHVIAQISVGISVAPPEIPVYAQTCLSL